MIDISSMKKIGEIKVGVNSFFSISLPRFELETSTENDFLPTCHYNDYMEQFVGSDFYYDDDRDDDKSNLSSKICLILLRFLLKNPSDFTHCRRRVVSIADYAQSNCNRGLGENKDKRDKEDQISPLLSSYFTMRNDAGSAVDKSTISKEKESLSDLLTAFFRLTSVKVDRSFIDDDFDDSLDRG